jgi:hypothetical protein
MGSFVKSCLIYRIYTAGQFLLTTETTTSHLINKNYRFGKLNCKKKELENLATLSQKRGMIALLIIKRKSIHPMEGKYHSIG